MSNAEFGRVERELAAICRPVFRRGFTFARPIPRAMRSVLPLLVTKMYA
jgi:hypothetical protein